MGPTKEPCLVNKHLSKISGEVPDKDIANASKSKIKKRKLSDMLDYRWTKEELKQFYNAFRKYGKNWKKVAGLIQNRSVDMVESLYNSNKAYLSLPEGMATADGFLAMMTDHYNILDGNDSDCERKGAPVKSLKPLKCSNGKCGQHISKGSDGHHLQNQSAQSNYRCMSKKYSEDLFTGCWPRAVGKRTPRLPIILNQGDGNNYVSANKHIIKPAPDEDTHTAALTLIEASQGRGSPLVSGSPGRSELIRSVKEKHAQADMATSSDINVRPDDNCLEVYSVRGETDNGIFRRDNRILDIDSVDQSGIQCKVKMIQEMRRKNPGTKNLQFNDVEAFSARGKGLKARKFKDKIDKDVSEQRNVQSSHGSREKSHLLFSEEPDVYGKKREGKKDSSYHPSKPEALSANPKTDYSKVSVQGDGGHSSSSVHKSNSPGSLTAIHGSVNSGISYRGDKEYYSTIAYKSNVPESLSRNPESVDSKILVQGNRECSSVVRVDDVPSKEAKLRKPITLGEISIKKVVSEAERTRCPYISTMQHSFAANDIGWMPLNPCQKVPQYPGNQNGIGGKFCKMFSGKKPDGCFKDCKTRHPTKLANTPKDLHEPIGADFCDEVVPKQSLDADQTSLNSSSKILCIMSMKQEGDMIDATVTAKAAAGEEVAAAQHTMCNQPCILAKIQSRESDIKAIADLTRALDKKEEVLKELRQMNDVVSEKRTGGALAVDSNHVIEQYSRIVKLLNEVNDEVVSASYNLRQRNTYSKDSRPQWPSTIENSTEYGRPSSSLLTEYLASQDSSSHVVEIVMSSRQKARAMVDAAVLAMSSLKEGGDAYMRIIEALDSAGSQRYAVGPNKLGTRYSCSYPSAYQNPAVSFTASANAPNPRAFSSANESEILSGLISDCIATVFMIQATSETRYPPADVARILEYAVESLQPRCLQNLPVYREIEICMGYIKTQTLALVETPNASLPTKISV